MKLNNKGFAITGVLYTVFILFLLIITSVLAGLQLKRTMLERSILLLEDSYIGENLYESEAGKEKIKKINKTKSGDNDPREAPVTGKYIFNIRNNFYTDAETKDFTYNVNCGQDSDCAYTFTAGKKGYYKLEVWGASGGNGGPNKEFKGGKGGYSSGLLFMDPTSETGIKDLYIVVGGKGTDGDNTNANKQGGYNGGGNKNNPDADWYSAAGGGATHIAAGTGLLSSLLGNNSTVYIVAGGGGGGAGVDSGLAPDGIHNYGFGGAGGGTTGGSGTNYRSSINIPNATGWGTGGTQDKGGCKSKNTEGTPPLCGTLGQGSSSGGHGGAGGGGYWGGGATDRGYIGGGGGGSGYLSPVLINGATIAGSQDIPEYPKQDEGNGYARITYYGENAATLKGLTFLYGFTGSVQDFEILKDGTYKIEAWGAQGGEFASTGQYAGKGGYASGFISYTEEDFNTLKNNADNHLYLYVGEKGKNENLDINFGGWNGGGPSGKYAYPTRGGGGGGATDIRLEPCGNTVDWDDEDSLHSRIMVAGGGGGSGNYTGYTITGGAGGGLVGGTGLSKDAVYSKERQPTGGSQTEGGANPLSVLKEVSKGKFGYAVQKSLNEAGYGGGGGGGYYGGAQGSGSGGSGGSGYVSGHKGCVSFQKNGTQECKTNVDEKEECSYYTDNNKVIKFSNTKLEDGDSGLVRSPVDVNYMTGNSGDGYVKITYMGNGDVKVNDITCVAYLTKGATIDNNINFLTDDCNDIVKENKSKFAFDQNLTDQDYNVITLANIYSFER